VPRSRRPEHVELVTPSGLLALSWPASRAFADWDAAGAAPGDRPAAALDGRPIDIERAQVILAGLASPHGAATAHHDLIAVRELTVTGWDGQHKLLKRHDGGAGVTIIAPRRHDGDEWTFARTGHVAAGRLACHGDRSDGADGHLVMLVLLPPELAGVLEVKFE